MGQYANRNAEAILANVNACIAELEEAAKGAPNYKRYSYRGFGYNEKVFFNTHSICVELNIFDWWNDTLSMSQLKQMKKFLETAIDLGFTGYVCFKVGAKGCSHGMWAHKKESTNGYSPDGDTLFHSFRSGDNYYDMELNGVWMHDKYAEEGKSRPDFNLKQIKAELASA